MEYNFSKRLESMPGTATREILKLLTRPQIISFAGGLPAREALPIDTIRQISDYILSGESAYSVLQYGTTEGMKDLLVQSARYLETLGLSPKAEETLIISGGQQGIDLAFKVFLNAGDCILVENPTYLAVLQILNSYECTSYGVNSTEQGLDIEDLERKIKLHKPKILYVVPTFSNPTGKTYSRQNRKDICAVCAKYGVIILEDDPYSRLRFEGQEVPPLKAFDAAGNVIFLASFSKTISPGLRVGVAYSSAELIRKMAICKQGTDLHTSNLSQAVIAEFLKRGLLYPQINSALPIYKTRKDAMKSAIERYMPDEFIYTNPEGGLFFWGELPDFIDTAALIKKAIERNVAYIQGSVFYADGGGKSTLRLNFSNADTERIEKGIKELGGLFKDEIAKGR